MTTAPLINVIVASGDRAGGLRYADGMPPFFPRAWSPAAILATGLVTTLGITALTLFLALHQPWLGLRLAGTEDEPGLQVRHGEGPSAGVPPGTRLLTLRAADAPPLPLKNGDLTPEPDTRYVQFDAYRRFLADQQALAEGLVRGPVELVNAEGGIHRVAPLDRRPWRSLPAHFWLQLVVAVTGFLIGLSVWTFRRGDRAAIYFAVTGVGLMLSAASAAVYSSRELALPAALFRLLHVVNGTGSLLFCAAFVATLWHYPIRLGRRDPGPVLIAGFMTMAALLALQWLPDFDVGLRVPVLAGYLATIALAAWQWRRTRGRPLERAALQWFLLAWFSGSTAFLALVFVPALFGMDTGALQAYAFALFLLIYSGVAFGIVRYRLFDLDRWWLNALSLLALAALMLSIGLLSLFVLGVDPLLATSLAIAGTGWLYLPLRGWLGGRLAPPPFETTLPTILQQVIASGAMAPQEVWREALRRLFRPLDLQVWAETVTRIGILDSGLVLQVPELRLPGSLRIVGCERGTRLFTERDRATVEAMRTVIERLVDYGHAVELGVERERLRVARDLHDDIGARLLDLLHRSEGPTQDRVRAILDELRLVIASLGSRGETLENLLGVCRAEAGERLEGGAVTLSWQQPESLPDLRLDPHLALLIVRTLRESVDNALRHARARRFEVESRLTGTRIVIRVRNDGVDEAASACEGRSLLVLRSRAEALGGSLDAAPDGSSWEVRLELPQRLPTH